MSDNKLLIIAKKPTTGTQLNFDLPADAIVADLEIYIAAQEGP